MNWLIDALKLNKDQVKTLGPWAVVFLVVGGGGSTIISDLRWLVGNIAVRNVGYFEAKICDGTAEPEFWMYLQDDLERYERYTGRVHRLSGVRRKELCE